jgi:hypothetical protein
METKMRVISRWIGILATLAVSASILIPGCSSFRSHKRMDLTPFAENMIALAGDIHYGLAQQEVVYLPRISPRPTTSGYTSTR